MIRAKTGLTYLELALGKISKAKLWEDGDIRHFQEVLGKLDNQYRAIADKKETIQ